MALALQEKFLLKSEMDINIEKDLEVFKVDRKQEERKIDRNFKSTLGIIFGLVFFIIFYTFWEIGSSDRFGIFIVIIVMTILLALAILDLNKKAKNGIDFKISGTIPFHLAFLGMKFNEYKKNNTNLKISSFSQGLKHYSILFFGNILEAIIRLGYRVISWLK